MTDDPASLTRDEAAARAGLLHVDRYEIGLDLTGLLEGETLISTSTIRFRCAQPGADTFVDCVADVVEASLNGVALDTTSVSRGRLPLSGLAEDNVLVVTARQDDTGSASGVLRTVDQADGLVYVWTSLAPDEARRVWACFDQPDLKAVHAFTVTAPESWTVLSNTAPAGVDDCPGGRRWVFGDSPRLSPYVMVVNAGPFHEIRVEHDGHDLGLYCRQSLVPLLERDAEEVVAITRHGLAWFGERFGMPFPQRRYDQIFVPGMPGAMENWGAVTHTDDLLFRSEPTHAERTLRAYVVLHEMAHMWFGDLVTMRWWDDLWLNESFASWAGTWAAAGMADFVDIWAGALVQNKRAGYAQDMSPATHPIRVPVEDVAAATAMFDAVTYEKGMAVLRQLVAYVGEPVFLRGLQAYFREHAWGNTVLADLMDAVGKAAGQDLSGWTAAWLDRAGTDLIALEGDRVVISGPDGDSPRPHRFDIASFTDDGELVGTVEVRTDGPEAAVELPAAPVHLLNAGDLTFAATRTDPTSRAWLRTNAGRLPDVTSRTLAVMETWHDLVHGRATGPDLAGCALSALRTERDPGLVENLLQLAVGAVEQWTTEELIEEQQLLVASAASALVEVAPRAALRALAGCASTAEHFDGLAGPAEADPELAWRVLVRRAELGEYDDDQVTALQARDPNPESAFSALAVRAARPDAAAKDEAWRAVMVDREVPTANPLWQVCQAFWRPQQRALLEPFTQRYLDDVRRLEGGMMSRMALAIGMYPMSVAGADFLAGAAALADDETVAPVIRQELLERNDGLARRLRVRAA